MTEQGRSEAGTMPFLEHLEELRWRIIKVLAAIIVCASFVYYFWDKLFELVIVYPLHELNPRPTIIFTAPSEAFVASIKVALFGGIILASPFILYQIWRFVAPGLFKKERFYVLIMVGLSVICFGVGIGFSFIATPQAIRFLTEYSTPSLVPFFSVNSYLSFILKFTFAFGLVFQLPAASFILARLGIVTHRSMLSHWRIAMVLIFIVAAIITPPDVISQTIMAVPLLLLYFISIGIARFAGKKPDEKGDD
jgi:sec-independent protein translocase protein TatC